VTSHQSSAVVDGSISSVGQLAPPVGLQQETQLAVAPGPSTAPQQHLTDIVSTNITSKKDPVISDVNRSEKAIEGIPGKLVNFVDSKCDLPKMCIQLNGHKVLALIDTGAVSSLISPELVTKLGLTVSEQEKMLQVIGEKSMKTMGSVNCAITIGGVKMLDMNFIV
jgi:hypothetical protein